jgi:hypothetical protein
MTQLPLGHQASLEQVLGSVMRFFTFGVRTTF